MKHSKRKKLTKEKQMEKQFSKHSTTEKKGTREIKIELSSQLKTSFLFF
jgi:hypothetical protein